MNKHREKLIHVEFHGNGEHFYFGSVSAIFQLFNKENIGVCLRTLYQFNIEPGRPYSNKKCIIRKGQIYRKAGGRDNSKKVNI